MLKSLLALALVPLLVTAAIAQTEAPAPVATPIGPALKAETVRVALQTSMGPIILELEKDRAPITTANFLRYVDQKRFDGATFYRATKVGTDGLGLIQGGARNDPKRVLKAIAHEPTTKTGLSHVEGAISMARAAPGSANGDFFITVGAFPSMDANPAQPGDNLGFAVFGRVAEGMDVVRKILAAPTSPTQGEGVMKGQMLAPPIRILSAKRAAKPVG
ncbi:MAG: cyclophilin type peptidyl-prolyl cis-trans isomerase [Alphaproteobacteria bacterium]|nr:cyclophilin type peptidyl-prolyl cis-trans isomerase [Alphaproteobacteria bacterium]